MDSLPQLFMRHPDITKLPELKIPDGLTLKTHTEDMVAGWEELIEKAFKMKFDFNECIVKGRKIGEFDPEHVLYLMRDDKILATATVVEHDGFPGEGWFRMIAASPEETGKGYGKLICLAALHNLAKRGYKSVVLSTDDDRVPALRTYLGLGFEPIYSHESHQARWENIFKKLKK